MSNREGFKECWQMYTDFAFREDAYTDEWWTELIDRAWNIGKKYPEPVKHFLIDILTFMENNEEEIIRINLGRS